MRPLFIAALAAALCCYWPQALAVIDPDDYATSGSLTVASGTVEFNTDTLQVLLNGNLVTSGYLTPQPNGVDLAVFAFNNIQIGGAATTVVRGQRPLALASKGSLTVGDINANGVSSDAPPGGYDGGTFVSLNDKYTPTDGYGPGGGQVGGLERIATGGGFGGAGGHVTAGSGTVAGGRANGNLLSSIEGGSGGAAAALIFDGQTFLELGGAGGGGIALVANGAVSAGILNVNGQDGYYAGGGAGGGILISGSSVTFTGLTAHGGNALQSSAYSTGGGGGRIAILGGSTFSLDSPLGSDINVTGGFTLGESPNRRSGRPGVITFSPQTFVATGNRVLDGSLLVGNYSDFATVEVEVRRNLSVAPGARVALGKDQPLDLAVAENGASTAALTIGYDYDSFIAGVFDTGPYSQRVGALNGSGTLRLSQGGRLTVDGSPYFDGPITGPGTLAVSSGAELKLVHTVGTPGYPDWTGTAEVAGTLAVGAGPLKARVVGGAGAQLIAYDEYFETLPVDLAGDLSDFHGTVRIDGGALRVAALGALDTPAAVVFAGTGTPSLVLNSWSATVGNITGSNASASIDLGVATLTVGRDDVVGAFNGSISGNGGGLKKVGNGILFLEGPLTYTGPTTVREGTLSVRSPLGPGATVRVEAAGHLEVEASVARPIAGVGPSSVISVTTDSPLTLGASGSFLGFVNQGELRVGLGNVTLNAAGAVRPGALTTLGVPNMGFGDMPGTLATPNGAIVDFGEAITGFGTINSPNTLAKRIVVNGAAQGTSATLRLNFTGYVKGTGSFDNVTFSGTFAPGLSPAIVSAGSITLAASNTLEIELGGTSPGSGYDKIESAGALALGGALNVALLGGFVPAAGQSFDILDWGNVSGAFSSITLPPLAANLAWNKSALYTTGALAVTYSGDFDFDFDVDDFDFLKWQRGESPGGAYSATDYAAWKSTFGLVAAAPVAAPVPEPSALLLAAIVAAACCLGRSRPTGR